MTQLTDVSPLNAQFLRKNFVLRQGAYVCICRSRFMRGSLDANCPTVLETACDCPKTFLHERSFLDTTEATVTFIVVRDGLT